MPLLCTFAGDAIITERSAAKKINPATLSFFRLLNLCVQAIVPPAERRIPTGSIMKNNTEFLSINCLRESLRNLDAKSGPSRNAQDKPSATQMTPSVVMTFGRGLDTERVYTLPASRFVTYEQSLLLVA